MSVARFWAAVAAFVVLPPSAIAQSSALSFRPIAAEYSTQLDRIIMISANPNQLHIYNAATNADVTVALPKAPLLLSVSPDGLHAAVSNDASLSYVNLISGAVERTYPISTTGQTLALGASYAYIIGQPTTSVNLSSGAMSTNPVYTRGGRLHPSGLAIYATDGSVLQRLDTSTGPALGLTDAWSYRYPACGPIWFSQDGSRIYNGCGTVSRYSPDPKVDMTYATSFGALHSMIAFSESAALKRIAVVSNGTTPSPTDSEILLFGSDALTQIGRFALKDFAVESRSYKAHGRSIFFNSSGTALYVIVQADLTSGLLNDFAVQTFPLGASAACTPAFSLSSASVPAAGSYGTVGIASAPDCIFQASSNADWIVLTSGAYGSGNATLTYLVRTNLSPASRTGTISTNGQALTITQAAASGSVPAFNRIAYKIVDAAYTNALDKVVFVTSAPNELHVLDAVTQADRFIPLPAAPYSLSVGPDGLKAAVGGDGSIAYVNLETMMIEATLWVGADAQYVVLAGNGFIYAFPSRIPSYLYSVEVASGSATASSLYLTPRAVRLHPNGKLISAPDADKGTTWDISAGPAVVADSPTNHVSTCGNLWFTEMGDRAFTACATSYAVPAMAGRGVTGPLVLSNTNRVQWVADSAANSSTVVIPDGATPDAELQMYSGPSLAYSGSLTLPGFASGSSTYAGHGRFVFWNSAGNKLIIIEQADASASLASDFATYVVDGSACSVTLNPPSVTAPYIASSGAISVTPAGNCMWISSTTTPWLSISAGNAGLGSASLAYSAAPNDTIVPRTGSITISGSTLAIAQPAAPVVLNPTSASVRTAATTGTVTVTTSSPAYAWTATSDAPWLTITSGASGTGNGQVSYSVAANTSGLLRRATLSIGSASFVLDQAGVDATITILGDNPVFVPAVATVSSIYASVYPYNAAYRVTSNASWITITSPSPVMGDTISFSTTSNPNRDSRTGTITVGYRTLTVVQLGLGQLTIAPVRTTFATEGGLGSFSVTVNGNVSWTAKSSDRWVVIGSGGTGTTSGVVNFGVAPNPTTSSRTATITVLGQTLTITQPAPPAGTQPGLGFVPITPCRIVDTRGESGKTGAFGPPVMAAGTSRSFPIPTGPCGIAATAKAYSVNVTVVPQEPLGFLTLWPTGQPQPWVSTLNSLDGRIVANGAIVPAGKDGSISAYVTNTTHLIIDVNGYFDPDPTALRYGTGLPCRVVDTRLPNGALGGPALSSGMSRNFALQNCKYGWSEYNTYPIPASTRAYLVNATVVPAEPLGYLTLWPGGGVQPYVSTLNSLDGSIVANMSIVPRGVADLSAVATGRTDLVIDLIGTFGPTDGWRFYPVTPCRLADTRLLGPQGRIRANGSTGVALFAPNCTPPPSPSAVASVNITAIPSGPLGYLTAWTEGNPQPLVSLLNSPKGRIVSNATTVWFGDMGAMSIFATDETDVVVDLNGYFAP